MRGRERSEALLLTLLPGGLGKVTAARFARTLIRCCAPPSPASQEKGCPRLRRRRAVFGFAGERLDPPAQRGRLAVALLPFTGEGARRADEGTRAQRSAAFDFAAGWLGKSNGSSLRSHPHPVLRTTFSRFAGEGLSSASQEKGCLRLRGRKAGSTGAARAVGGSPSPVYGRRCPEGG